MRLLLPVLPLVLALGCELDPGEDSGLEDTEAEDTETEHTPHWSYEAEGEAIPQDRWAEHWPTCGGQSQSPIDIKEEEVTISEEYDFQWLTTATPLHAEHNGHTIEWKVAPGSTLTLDGVTWPLVQLHIHAPSEHTISGVTLPLEMHFVHLDDRGTEDKADDSYAVIGLWFEETEEPNPDLTTIGFDRLPNTLGAVLDDPTITFDPASLLPTDFLANPYAVRYTGSLTTPPCTEGVSWYLSAQTRGISATQLAAVEAIVEGNARHTQAVNGREIWLWEE